MIKNRLDDLKTIDELISPIADDVIECFKKDVTNAVVTGQFQLDEYNEKKILEFLNSDMFKPAVLHFVIDSIVEQEFPTAIEAVYCCMKFIEVCEKAGKYRKNLADENGIQQE